MGVASVGDGDVATCLAVSHMMHLDGSVPVRQVQLEAVTSLFIIAVLQASNPQTNHLLFSSDFHLSLTVIVFTRRCADSTVLLLPLVYLRDVISTTDVRSIAKASRKFCHATICDYYSSILNTLEPRATASAL